MAQRTPGPAKFAAAKAFCQFNLASFIIGAKVANVINVAVKLLDALGQVPAGLCNAFVYLSSSADGHALSGVAPSSATAIGTNGVIVGVHSNSLAFDVLSNTGGLLDLNITQTAGGTPYYLCVCMPDGSVVVSPVIQF